MATGPGNNLIMSPAGLQEPLCNDCQTPDCSNPIEEQLVSTLGIAQNMRLWVINNVVRQVVACRGYVGADDVVGRPKGHDQETDTSKTEE